MFAWLLFFYLLYWHYISISAGVVVTVFRNIWEDRDSGRPCTFWTHARTAILSFSSFPSPSKIKHLGAESMMCTSRCWENDIGNGWHTHAVCSPITCAQTRHFFDRVLSISSLPRHGNTLIVALNRVLSTAAVTTTLLILIFVGTWAIWEFQPCTANVVPVDGEESSSNILPLPMTVALLYPQTQHLPCRVGTLRLLTYQQK